MYVLETLKCRRRFSINHKKNHVKSRRRYEREKTIVIDLTKLLNINKKKHCKNQGKQFSLRVPF